MARLGAYYTGVSQLEQLGGELDDAQHGARTGPASAHEFADISGRAHSALSGIGPSDHHPRAEAKATAGAAASEAVTWTTAFPATPIVTSDVHDTGGVAAAYYSNVRSRSTTGATVNSWDAAGVAAVIEKMVIAQEAT